MDLLPARVRSLRVHPALLGAAAVVLLSAFAYAPLLGGGMLFTGDTLHPMRLFAMDRCFADGQLPCRWSPDLGNGYGFPLFNYYPPLPYYAGELLHELGFSYLATVNALYLIGLAGAALSMYVLARRLWGELGGVVSAVAYVYAPYLALDVYMRGALVELWALAVAPALLWAVLELVTTARARFVPLVALLLALLLLSHNLVAVIVAPAVAIWAAGLLALHGREAVRPALLGVAAAAWGFGLAAFFTLPVLLEGDLVQLDSLTSGPFRYDNNYASLGDLFLLRTNDYSFLLGVRDGTPLQIGWFHWAFAGLSLPAAALLWRRDARVGALAAGVFAACFAIGVFMSVPASGAIWATFDPLRFLQFPWRYLGLVSIGAAGLAGAWLALLRERPLRAQLGVAAVLVGVFVGTGEHFFQPFHRCQAPAAEQALDCPGNDGEYFAPERFYTHQQGSVRDYLPVAVDEVPESPPEAPARVVEGSGRVAPVDDATSDGLRFRVEAETAVVVEAAVFDFDGWQARIDGRNVAHTASVPSGLITLDLASGRYDVELRLEGTAARTAGNWLSLASWGALVLGVPLVRALRRG